MQLLRRASDVSCIHWTNSRNIASFYSVNGKLCSKTINTRLNVRRLISLALSPCVVCVRRGGDILYTTPPAHVDSSLYFYYHFGCLLPFGTNPSSLIYRMSIWGMYAFHVVSYVDNYIHIIYRIADYGGTHLNVFISGFCWTFCVLKPTRWYTRH